VIRQTRNSLEPLWDESMASDSIETVLRKTPLFAGLSAEEMHALRPRVVSRKCDRGEILFNEGDACRGLYVVGSGKVRIYKVSASGREQVLSIEKPGSSFAELPVFDGGNYPASAVA
jgi:CRP-like cAMP-binding protein